MAKEGTMYDRRWKELSRLLFAGEERAVEFRPVRPPTLTVCALLRVAAKTEACLASLGSILVACRALV